MESFSILYREYIEVHKAIREKYEGRGTQYSIVFRQIHRARLLPVPFRVGISASFPTEIPGTVSSN